MNLIRNDRQVALNDLLVAVQESADHYQDAANFLEDEPTCVYLQQFAKQRLILTSHLEDAVRAEGDLPSAPDPDRETGSMLLEHLGANLSADEAATVIEHRLQKEEELAELIENAREIGIDDNHAELLKDLDENNRLILQSLRDLLKHHSE